MEISDIRRTKRGRISIYIDGTFACVLHPEVFALSSLTAGGGVEPEELSRLQHRSLEKFAREKALALLSQRGYSSARLREKLVDFVEDEEIADGAVARMVELGLVDDLDYARRYAADCLNLKRFSLSRTVRALREKGIGREIIDQVLEELDHDPQPVIAEIILKKYRRHLAEEKGIAKTVAALQRQGYRYGDIKAVLRNLAEDEDYYNGNE